MFFVFDYEESVNDGNVVFLKLIFFLYQSK